MTISHRSHLDNGSGQDSLSDAEKGMYDSTVELTAPPPFSYMIQKKSDFDSHLFPPTSPVHEGITPLSSVPQLSLAFPSLAQATDAEELKVTVSKPTPPPKRKISRWVLFNLWFNTYRKFFIFVTMLNLTGIILAAVGRFHYAEDHLGALVLGNLLMAILMRNELFMRFLYIIAIYGLRSVSLILQ